MEQVKRRGRPALNKELAKETMEEVEIPTNDIDDLKIDKTIKIDIFGENKTINFHSKKEERKPRWVGSIDVFDHGKNELELNVL